MAERKQEHLVKLTLSGTIHVWTTNPTDICGEIQEIEGVLSTMMITGNPIFANVDPRYRGSDVAEEIRVLLASEVPDVFMDD